MPANLTPQYLKAEEAFKSAKTPEEKISCLEEMLRLMPKHKGTDHLQADLKRRLSRLRGEAEETRSKKKGTFDPFRVERGGAGQVLVLGGPNSGKSALVGKLTKAVTQVTPYPFATTAPVPGMMAFEDVSIQLVDLPSVLGSDVPPGMRDLAKGADGAILLLDLDAPEVLEHFEAILRGFGEGRVRFVDRSRPAAAPGAAPAASEGPELLWSEIPVLVLANKADVPGALEMLPLLAESIGDRFTPIPISAERGDGLAEVPRRVFEMLDLIRAYAKPPGKPPDMSSPFALPRGSTVLDLARHIHRDFPDSLREARVWGSARFGGQAVPRDHVLEDKDVVELHVDIG